MGIIIILLMSGLVLPAILFVIIYILAMIFKSFK